MTGRCLHLFLFHRGGQSSNLSFHHLLSPTHWTEHQRDLLCQTRGSRCWTVVLDLSQRTACGRVPCSRSQRSAVARAQEGPAVVEFGFCAPTGPALRPLEGSVQDPTARCQAAGEPQPMSATAMHSQRQEHRFVGTHFFLASSFRDPSM